MDEDFKSGPVLADESDATAGGAVKALSAKLPTVAIPAAASIADVDPAAKENPVIEANAVPANNPPDTNVTTASNAMAARIPNILPLPLLPPP